MHKRGAKTLESLKLQHKFQMKKESERKWEGGGDNSQQTKPSTYMIAVRPEKEAFVFEN